MRESRFRSAAALAALLMVGCATAAPAAEAPPLLLQSPTLSADAIAFAYAGDLWSVPRSGGEARRLTSTPERESRPAYSPDGRWLAFTGESEGNADVWVMPAAGGPARRLTWHPGPDEVVGWTPDGARILFRSPRESPTDYERLFTLGLDGGLPVAVDLPAAHHGAFSPDGARLAYVPNPKWQEAWKRYRGGQTTPIWIADLATAAITKVPRANSNDFNPLWDGRRLLFLSDRDGPVTLFAWDTGGGAVTRLLPATGFDVKSAAAGPGGVVYDKFGELRLYDPATGADRRVPVTVTADLPGARPRWVPLADKVQAAAISPGGARAAFEARGEIFTVPAEKGDARNLSASPATAERDPAWSPDGTRLAWFSDASGEYALCIRAQDGRGETRVIGLGDPPSFFYQPRWSPDGKRICYHDKRLTLWYVDLEKGAPVRVDTDRHETFERSFDPQWSPDSRWLVYTKKLASNLHAVFACDTRTGEVAQLTDGMSDARYPVFDRGGKYLFFTASTDVGLAASWLDQSSLDRPVTRSAYVMVLRRGLPSPLAPESDEEKPAADEGAGAPQEKARDKAAKPGKEAKSGQAAAVPEVTIDREGLGQRILALPVPARNYAGLAAGAEGVLFLLEAPAVIPADAEEAPALTVHRFTLAKREPEKFLADVTAFTVAAGGGKVLYGQGGGWFIAGADAPPEAGKGALKLDGMQLLVDPPAEWRHMYDEVWRLERDFLYDPDLHGLDLAKARARYAPFVAGLGSRWDLNALFEEMLGEITVGHMFVGGGDAPRAKPVPNGLLGCDFAVENGRYRLRRVYDGENWNPQLHAPLTQPGVDARAGEYLLAIGGRDLRLPVTPYELLANAAGRQVTLTLAADASGKGSREVTVVPVADEAALRRFAWIEDNRRTVDRLSGGRCAYVYLPDTAGGGYTYFTRYFFAQVGREAAVLDERFNHGGLIADYVIDLLRRVPLCVVAARSGADQPCPAASIPGPKVMVVNEMAGSGGDAMPWYFRTAGLGKLVGTRTWGGLVGIWDYPPLLDGGYVTAPRGALYGLKGEWEVENRGITPDLEVELDPALWRQGRDPQLEAAVKVAMDELQQHPVPTYVRPPYPDYHKGGDLGR